MYLPPIFYSCLFQQDITPYFNCKPLVRAYTKLRFLALMREATKFHRNGRKTKYTNLQFLQNVDRLIPEDKANNQAIKLQKKKIPRRLQTSSKL